MHMSWTPQRVGAIGLGGTAPSNPPLGCVEIAITQSRTKVRPDEVARLAHSTGNPPPPTLRASPLGVSNALNIFDHQPCVHMHVLHLDLLVGDGTHHFVNAFVNTG